MLVEFPLPCLTTTVPNALTEFATEGLRRSKSIRCFDFVPSSYPVVYRALRALPRGQFCEWGSGIGINVGMATFWVTRRSALRSMKTWHEPLANCWQTSHSQQPSSPEITTRFIGQPMPISFTAGQAR